jgi:hypothetical protein
LLEQAGFALDAELSFEPVPAAPMKPVSIWDNVADPTPEWAEANPDRFLALLMVAPRDCAAIDTLTA